MKRIVLAGIAVSMLTSQPVCSMAAETVQPGKIGAYGAAQCSYAKNYSDVETLLADTELVVYGEVIHVRGFCDSGTIWSDLTVEIKDPMSSALKAGDMLHIYEQKGQVSVEDFIGSYQDPLLKEMWNMRYANETDQERAETYICQTDGTDLTEAGDASVYCLKMADPWMTEEETVYYRVGAYCGEYKKIGEDCFRMIPPNDDKIAPAAGTAEPRGYTLAELKELLKK